jgi:hypothetical protein
MKIVSKLGLSITLGLLAAACSSSNNTPASTGTSTGSSSGSGSGSASGAGTGTSSGGTGASGTSSGSSGAGSGTSSGAGTGTASGTASGATSGTTTEAGSPEASTTEEASTTVEAGSDAASVATLTAECTGATPHHGGGVAFSAQDFCTIFISTCVPGYLIASESALGVQSTCETTYAALIASDQVCRTDHVCNATGAGQQTTHCPHAQGWSTATTQAGGPCN